MFCNNKMSSPTTMTILMLSFFIVLFSFPFALGSTFSKIQLPPTLTGPESVAFDPRGGGPYIVVTDGRVLKWLGPNTGFVDFATTSTQRTKQLCDGTKNPDLGPICGRPLGFSFNSITGDLYIADAYLGLHVVGPNGGLATRLATSAEGVPFRLLNGVDIDQITGSVYFTDSSTTFELRNIVQPNFVPDSTGRLMRYDPRTKEVKVLLRGLFVAVGPAAGLDGSFVVVSELFAKRIIRFWVTGLKRGTSEVLLNLPGNPNKIKRTPLGDFWVAVNVMNNQQGRLITTPQGFRFNAFGNVLRNFGLQEQYFNTSINVIQEQLSGSLYVGSRDVDFVGVYSN